MLRALVFAWSVTLWLLCGGVSASAQEGHAAPEERARRLVFLLPTSEESAPPPAMLDAIRSQLVELDVELLLETRDLHELAVTSRAAAESSRATGALAVVWLEVRPHALVVYFYQREGSRLLSRSVSVSESQAAAAEEVAVVIRSAVSAVLEGAQVMMTEVVVPSPPTPKPKEAKPPEPAPPAAPPHSAYNAEFSLGYLGALPASDAPIQSGARLAASLAPTAKSGFRATLAFQFLPTWTGARDGVSFSLRRHPLEALLGFAFARNSFRLIPELGLVADLVRRETDAVLPPFVESAPSNRWIWAVPLRLRGVHLVSGHLGLYSALGADFLVRRSDEVILRGSQSETVASWLRVRPEIEAGLSVSAF